jgi:hypothetical protein
MHQAYTSEAVNTNSGDEAEARALSIEVNRTRQPREPSSTRAPTNQLPSGRTPCPPPFRPPPLGRVHSFGSFAAAAAGYLRPLEPGP